MKTKHRRQTALRANRTRGQFGLDEKFSSGLVVDYENIELQQEILEENPETRKFVDKLENLKKEFSFLKKRIDDFLKLKISKAKKNED